MGSGARRRVRSAVVGASLLALAATVPNGLAVPPNALSAGVANVSPQTHTHSFDVINTGGGVTGSSSWRVVHDTGNCCENYLASTASGRLLNLGGGEIFFSDDRGATWKVVRPTSPMLGAEGAIVAAPDGDIAAFTWDPYTGDRVISYKFTEGRWFYTEGVLHVPFPDRPWISVVPGPFEIGGQTVPYLTLMKAGWPFQEVWLQSVDGLNYVRPSTPVAEQYLGTERAYLDLAVDPVRDYTQSAYQALTSPLGGGRALSLRAGFGRGCQQRMMRTDATWSCFELPDGRLLGRTIADSRGWLHDVAVHSQDATIRYSLSSDGGRTWTTTTIPLPPEYFVWGFGEWSDDWDFRVNGAAGVAAIALHAQHSTTGRDQDFIYKLSVATTTPSVSKIIRIGRGDVAFDGGVMANGPRFDFPSMALFPDGRVALSYGDSGHIGPAVAIEL